MVQPKGAKVYVEVLDKPNLEKKTESGIYISGAEKDSHDTALLLGRVIEVGTKEIDAMGNERIPDVIVGASVYFNRYNAFRVVVKGMTEYYLVDCKDIWGVGTVD